jgi:hypothetical protein
MIKKNKTFYFHDYIKLKNLTLRVFVSLILFGSAIAQSPVTLTVSTQSNGIFIPDDFSGISLEMGSLKSGNGGTTGNMFDDATVSPSNLHTQVITLFEELGIKNIRVGGGSVDMNIVPTNADIDAFFRFVKVTNVNVIYSVQLLKGNISDDTNTIKYIWKNYKPYINCFAIGNEPDWKSYHTQDPAITDYPTYLTDWRKFASAVTTAVTDVKLGGPDTGSNYPVSGATNTNYNSLSWTANFANDEKSAGIVKLIFLHNYVGQSASGTAQQMIDKMLSTTWPTTYYPALYNGSCTSVVSAGFPFRLTESNSFSGAVTSGSNSFATALFALDYMHWWAAHGSAGVNFHNKQWVGNGPIYLDAAKNFQVYPVGYGIKAFDIGGHGSEDSVIITNPNSLNLTAYAVSDPNSLYVTIINKEHGTGARSANVKIIAGGLSDSASIMYLIAQNGVNDTANVTLGGSAITNSGWDGIWSKIDSTNINAGSCMVTIPVGSAAIVKIMNRNLLLPVELTSFTSSINSLGVNLQWTTATEVNNSGFDVERAVDNVNFEKIGFVKGSVNSTSPRQYSFTDKNNFSGNIQYRLKQIDNNGAYKYSQVIEINKLNEPTSYKLGNYPNPFNPSTIIRFELPENTFVNITVYNMLGKRVATLINQKMEKGIHEINFKPEGLATGIYVYQMNAGSKVITQKMTLLK